MTTTNDRELQATRDLCAAQKRKIDRLQRRINVLEERLQAAKACGVKAPDSNLVLDVG